MKKLIYLYLMCSFIALAQEKGVKIQIFDPDIDSSSLEEKYQVSREADTFSAIPNKEERDEKLTTVPSSQNWDEVEKDIFIMDVKNKTIEELISKYPELTRNDFLKLKSEK